MGLENCTRISTRRSHRQTISKVVVDINRNSILQLISSGLVQVPVHSSQGPITAYLSSGSIHMTIRPNASSQGLRCLTPIQPRPLSSRSTYPIQIRHCLRGGLAVVQCIQLVWPWRELCFAECTCQEGRPLGYPLIYQQL